MGLDTVELVMEFEDAFALTIPDEDASEMQTIGDVTAWLCEQLALEGRPRSHKTVFDQVCLITREQVGVPKDWELTEATSFVNDLGLD